MSNTWCVRERKRTSDVPGSGRYTTTTNGRTMLKTTCASCGATKSRFVKSTSGGAIDIHKAIGRAPKPAGGWTPGSYKYLGPYNPLEKQLTTKNLSGVSVDDFYANPSSYIDRVVVPPKNKLDRAAMHHDIAYGIAGNDRKEKNKADRYMVQEIDRIPYGETTWVTPVTRNIINTKQRLGLGTKKRTQHGRTR